MRVWESGIFGNWNFESSGIMGKRDFGKWDFEKVVFWESRILRKWIVWESGVGKAGFSAGFEKV